MGISKQIMLEQMDEDDNEIVAECDWCGADVTAARLNEMPYDGGEPVFVMCEECDVRDDKSQTLDPPDDFDEVEL